MKFSFKSTICDTFKIHYRVFQSSQNQTLQSLQELQDVPGFNEILRVSEMYMRVLSAILTKSEGKKIIYITMFNKLHPVRKTISKSEYNLVMEKV